MPYSALSPVMGPATAILMVPSAKAPQLRIRARVRTIAKIFFIIVALLFSIYFKGGVPRAFKTGLVLRGMTRISVVPTAILRLNMYCELYEIL